MSKIEYDAPSRESMGRRGRSKERSQGHENYRKRRASRALRLAWRHKQREAE